MAELTNFSDNCALVTCLHPYCPLGQGLPNWQALIASPNVGANPVEQVALVAALAAVHDVATRPVALPPLRGVVRQRLLRAAPCLYGQVTERVTPRAVVHLCEATLVQPISSANVETAFRIQNPADATITFTHAPLVPGAPGGDIMETLCSELLTNEGLPLMAIGPDHWPIWLSPSHVSLNAGKYSALKMYGDILIPAAPHNVLISVKSVKARERFLVSGNRLESVGFGFFDQPSEFWSISRMKLFKRWGFVAIYMPADTLAAVTAHLLAEGTTNYAININGKSLYRSLTSFTSDMRSVAGRVTLNL